MKKEEYFLAIATSEKDEYIDYLYSNFVNSLDLKSGQDLLKLYDEIENYIVSAGKFYRNRVDLINDEELKEDTIYLKNIRTGLYDEIIFLKKLIRSKDVDNVYEIRMPAETYQHRIFVFPYDKNTNKIEVPFVTITYGFNKILQSRKKGSETTDLLRDSSQEIRNSFYANKSSIKEYLPYIFEGE